MLPLATVSRLAIVTSLATIFATPSVRAAEIPLSFDNEETRIAASLLLPDGPGPHPVAVFLHGSGPHTRDDQRPYAALLLEAGVGALISDKRGSGESTGDWTRASLRDLAGDAAAGLALLAARPDVDAERVGVFGGSQAAWVAPVMNEMEGRIAFFILLSGGGIRPRESELWAYGRALDHRRVVGAERARAEELLTLYFDYLATGRGRAELEAAIEAARSEPWYAALELDRVMPSEASRSSWEWVARFDPMPYIERMTAPTLLIFGDEDDVQPFERAAERWREGLVRAGNDRFVIEFLPGADHMLRLSKDSGHGSASHAAAAPFPDALSSVVRDFVEANVRAPVSAR